MSTPTPNAAPSSSGKRLVGAVILLAIVAAAVSWWFRYSSTHRAVEFWGPEAARLIRDAPRVTLRTDDPAVEGTNPADLPRDISGARGLTHLRSELLQDHSYDWTAKGPADDNWSSSLVFEETEGAEPRVVVLFSSDFHWAANGSADNPSANAVAVGPILAKGLNTFFADSQNAPVEQ